MTPDFSPLCIERAAPRDREKTVKQVFTPLFERAALRTAHDRCEKQASEAVFFGNILVLYSI